MPPEGREVGIEEIPDQMLLAMMTMQFRYVVPILYRSGQLRSLRLRRYLNSPLMPGLNRLLERLDLAAEAHDKEPRLKPAADLLRRARSDFEAAIVCSFSGLSFLCRDQMRDVMEIEYLLRDFRYDLARLDEWANALPSQEAKRFSARVLREREAKRRGVKPEELIDSRDYALHSKALHVTKAHFRSVPRGVESAMDRAAVQHGDMDLGEMFVHAGRLFDQASGLYEAAGLSSPVVGEDDPFNVAWHMGEKAHAQYVKTVKEAIRARKAASEKAEAQVPEDD